MTNGYSNPTVPHSVVGHLAGFLGNYTLDGFLTGLMFRMQSWELTFTERLLFHAVPIAGSVASSFAINLFAPVSVYEGARLASYMTISKQVAGLAQLLNGPLVVGGKPLSQVADLAHTANEFGRSMLDPHGAAGADSAPP